MVSKQHQNGFSYKLGNLWLLHAVRKYLGLKSPDMYSVHCMYSKVSIGKTGCWIKTRVKGHLCHVYLPAGEVICDRTQLWPHPSACAQQGQYHVKKFQHMDQLIKEWINTELHLTSMNQDDVFYLSRLWNPLIHSPEERIQPVFSRNVSTSPSWGYRSVTSILMPTVQSQLLPMQVLITPSAAKQQVVIRLQSLSTWFQHSIAEPPTIQK